MYTTTLVNVLHLLISNEPKQVTIVTRYSNVFEIMSKLIWKLYAENMISEEVANILLDKLYE
jgi:hypothetical protein